MTTTSPAYVLSSNGYYRWSYNSQEYDRFTITNEYDPDLSDPCRTLSSKKVSANIDYYGAGTGAFFIAYEFYWTSAHYPTGFSLANGLLFSTSFWIREGASSTISTVDNVQFRIISSMITSPQILYNIGFKASSPPSGWIPCHNTWAEQTYSGLTLSDSAVYILFGVYDAWTYDWSQNIKVHPDYFRFEYDLSSW